MLRRPIWHVFLLLLDFRMPIVTSKSIPPRFLVPFGLPCAYPLLQSPIRHVFLAPFGLPYAYTLLQSPFHHAFSLLLDFHVPIHYFEVHSVMFSRSFWTFIYLYVTSKSNPSRFLAPFGLPCASPLLQSPFRLVTSTFGHKINDFYLYQYCEYCN